MSGGYFDYNQFKIGYIVEKLKEVIRLNDSEELDEYGDPISRGYSEETIAEFKNGLALLKEAQIYAHRIDWLLSSDDSEETFHQRLNEDFAELRGFRNEQN